MGRQGAGSVENELARSLFDIGLFGMASEMNIIQGDEVIRGPTFDASMAAFSSIAGNEPASASEQHRGRLLGMDEDILQNGARTVERMARTIRDVREQIERPSQAIDNTGPAGTSAPVDAPGPLAMDKGRNKRASFTASKFHAERAGKGLRHFSGKVCAKVEEKGRTTYNEVADELVAELAAEGVDASQMDEKNIRRRVYDALNVLMAMEIIVKEKKEIFWKGLPNTSEEEIDRLQADCYDKADKLDKKRVYLSSLLSDYRCLRALVQRNASQPTVPDEQRLHTPFVVLYTLPHESGPPEAPVVEISPDNTEVIFDFKGRGFQMVYDKDILSMMELVKGDAQEEKEQGAGVGRKRAAVEMEGKEFIKTEDDVAGRTES